MGSSKKTVVGYRYLLDLFMAFGRGPLDEIVEIRAGDLTAWTGDGSVTSSVTTQINNPNLFGGDQREGGIDGPLQVFMGETGQVLPDAIKQEIAGSAAPLMGNFRRQATAYFSGLLTSMNPYPKTWAVRVRRSQKGWFNDQCWQPSLATISMNSGQVQAMNGAHIIYECATNPEWGRGLPASYIDEGSFEVAATALFQEGFGLCMGWSRQSDIDEFVQHVLDHIGAALFTSRLTGLLTLKLIRGDYNPVFLPTYGPTTGVLKVEDDSTAAQDNAFNEVIVTWYDPITQNQGTVYAQNIAAWQAQRAVFSKTVDYSGIPTQDLANQVALRDLQTYSYNLKRFKVTMDRAGYKLQPGDVFNLNWPLRNIANMVVRVGKIQDENGNDDGTIVLNVLQDQFGLPSVSYQGTPQNLWTPPDTSAQPSPHQLAVEVDYRTLYSELSQADLAAVTNDQCYAGALATRPGGLSLGYNLFTAAPSEVLTQRAAGSWVGNCTLTAALGPYDTAATIANVQDFDDTYVGQAVLIDSEICAVAAVSIENGTMTLTRGCVDTIPAAHIANTRVYFIDDGVLTSDERQYVLAEVISEQLLTRTTTQVQDANTATTLTVTMQERQGRPYPPGAVTLNGTPIFNVSPNAVMAGDLTFAWTDRDRITQQDQLIPHGAASIGPEDGVTYTMRVYDNSKPAGTAALRTATGLTSANGFDYDAAMSNADGNAATLRFELVSSRTDGDGTTYEALYPYSIVVLRDNGGYGLSYGSSYGGAN